MRTPGHDDELAAGFLLTEGVVARRGDIRGIAPAATKDGGVEPNIIDVSLVRPEAVDFARLTRHVFTASSCGLCGKATIAAVQARNPAISPEEGPRVTAEVLARMPVALAAAQATFQRTGGLHAAGLFDAGGRLLMSREDVGRHNAVDKAVGHLLLSGGIDPAQVVLLVSGRVAFEIVQKGPGRAHRFHRGHLGADQPGGGFCPGQRADAGRLFAGRGHEHLRRGRPRNRVMVRRLSM